MPERGYRYAVSACSTYHSTFAEDLTHYAAAGVDGIGLWESKLPAGADGAAVTALRDSGLVASFCFPEVPSPLPGDTLFRDPADPAERIEEMCRGIERLAVFDPIAVICYAGPPGRLSEAQARRWVVEGLRRAGDTAGRAGVGLALEVLRPSPGGSLASTVVDALELIDESGAENIGVLVDVWHAWDVDVFVSELHRFADRIVGVQVCDRPASPRSWLDRRLPGGGDLPLVDIVRAAREAGVAAWFELEIFSDDGTFGHDYPDSLWKLPPEDLLTRSLADFDRIWRAAA